jgi:uncharacterized membrane protein YphA (DoxX/SURF4 family)
MQDTLAIIAAGLTMAAAVMVALNLGARITGFGFIVFTLGSIAWVMVAWLSDQSSLLWTNITLLVINLLGVWRWLGVRARYDKGAAAANEGATPS